MNQDQTNALIARLIANVQANTSDDAAEPMRDDAAFFCDPDRFARERQQFFLETPQVIGFAGEVAAPFDFATYDVLGIPVLVTRDADGVLRAFVNACAHKGARVGEGRGHARRFTCGFHGWTYRDDGSLAGRPQAQCFADDADALGLRALAVSERSGMIVVGPTPAVTQQEVDAHLDSIAAELAGFDLATLAHLETRRFAVAANWKLVAGLSFESYHFATLHRNSVAAFLHDNYVADYFGRHSRWSFPLIGIERLADRPQEQWPRFVPGAVSHAFFPGTVMITNPSDAQLIRTEPGPTPETSVVFYTGVFRDRSARENAYAAYDFGGRAFEDEDLVAAVACQQGLSAAGMAFPREFPIGRNEAVVQFWHGQWRAELR